MVLLLFPFWLFFSESKCNYVTIIIFIWLTCKHSCWGVFSFRMTIWNWDLLPIFGLCDLGLWWCLVDGGSQHCSSFIKRPLKGFSCNFLLATGFMFCLLLSWVTSFPWTEKTLFPRIDLKVTPNLSLNDDQG